MSDKPKNVIKVPEITPERLEKNEEEQRTWRELFRHVPVSADEYANRVIKDNLAVLDSLDRQLRAAARFEKLGIKQKIHDIRTDTAIWLSSVGQFAAALKISTDREEKKLYRKYIAAIALADDAWCGHPLFEHIDGQLSQVAYREFDFFSDSHAKKVSMVRCRQCDFRNARDLDVELQKLSEHRAQVVASGEDKPVKISEVIS